MARPVLYLAGPPEARAALKAPLSRRARAAVAGEGAIPLYAEGNELLSRVLALCAAPDLKRGQASSEPPRPRSSPGGGAQPAGPGPPRLS